MLELVLFFVFMVIAILCARTSVSHEHDVDYIDATRWQMASHGAALTGLAISWERTGAVLLDALRMTLPQIGTGVASFTAYAVTGIVGLVVVAGVPFATMMLISTFRESEAAKRSRYRHMS